MKVYGVDNQEEGFSGMTYLSKRKDAVGHAYETAANSTGTTHVWEYTTPRPSKQLCIGMLNGVGWVGESRVIAGYVGDYVRDEDGYAAYPLEYEKPRKLTKKELADFNRRIDK